MATDLRVKEPLLSQSQEEASVQDLCEHVVAPFLALKKQDVRHPCLYLNFVELSDEQALLFPAMESVLHAIPAYRQFNAEDARKVRDALKEMQIRFQALPVGDQAEIRKQYGKGEECQISTLLADIIFEQEKEVDTGAIISRHIAAIYPLWDNYKNNPNRVEIFQKAVILAGSEDPQSFEECVTYAHQALQVNAKKFRDAFQKYVVEGGMRGYTFKEYYKTDRPEIVALWRQVEAHTSCSKFALLGSFGLYLAYNYYMRSQALKAISRKLNCSLKVDGDFISKILPLRKVAEELHRAYGNLLKRNPGRVGKAGLEKQCEQDAQFIQEQMLVMVGQEDNPSVLEDLEEDFWSAMLLEVQRDHPKITKETFSTLPIETRAPIVANVRKTMERNVRKTMEQCERDTQFIREHLNNEERLTLTEEFDKLPLATRARKVADIRKTVEQCERDTQFVLEQIVAKARQNDPEEDLRLAMLVEAQDYNSEITTETLGTLPIEERSLIAANAKKRVLQNLKLQCEQDTRFIREQMVAQQNNPSVLEDLEEDLWVAMLAEAQEDDPQITEETFSTLPIETRALIAANVRKTIEQNSALPHPQNSALNSVNEDEEDSKKEEPLAADPSTTVYEEQRQKDDSPRLFLLQLVAVTEDLELAQAIQRLFPPSITFFKAESVNPGVYEFKMEFDARYTMSMQRERNDSKSECKWAQTVGGTMYIPNGKDAERSITFKKDQFIIQGSGYFTPTVQVERIIFNPNEKAFTIKANTALGLGGTMTFTQEELERMAIQWLLPEETAESP